jgi:KDO2-lipid IV(A) lauroyltransferase
MNRLLDLMAVVIVDAFRLVPRRLALAAGGGFGRLAGALAGRKKLRTIENLQRAGVEDARRACRRAWSHAGRTLFEMLWMLTRSPERLLRDVEVQGLEVLQEAAANGRGVLMVGGHIGNWELGILAAARAGPPFAVIVRSLRTPRLERRIIALRERGGIRTIVRTKQGASVATYRWMARGGILACMMDRSSSGRRVAVPFLGNATRMPLGPVALAIRSGAAVVLGSTRRRPDGVTVGSLRRLPTDGIKDEHEIARIIGRAMEETVADRPEEWFWIYRKQDRWQGEEPAATA